MRGGRFIAVVGPSGAGKDSVMAGLHGALPHSRLVRRVITRAPELGGEVYDAVSEAEFLDRARRGEFAVHWTAHGLCYGIPRSVETQLNNGTDCLANLSRKVLLDAAKLFPDMVVLNITARPETLAARLALRGRETKEEIANRLAEAQKPLPSGLNIISVPNDGPLDETIKRAVAALQKVNV